MYMGNGGRETEMTTERFCSTLRMRCRAERYLFHSLVKHTSNGHTRTASQSIKNIHGKKMPGSRIAVFPDTSMPTLGALLVISSLSCSLRHQRTAATAIAVYPGPFACIGDIDPVANRSGDPYGAGIQRPRWSLFKNVATTPKSRVWSDVRIFTRSLSRPSSCLMSSRLAQ